LIITAEEIAKELENPRNPEDRLIITPKPDLGELRESGAASVDLRLGCWFLTYRPSRIGYHDTYPKASDEKAPDGKTSNQKTVEVPSEAKLAKSHYVRFGEGFFLHPRAFVLAVTLEWIRLPADRAAYVIGRSSWGRHGLIIATATGVHPGFTGCLTLELSNTGEIPIKVKPGSQICQIFIHEANKLPRSKFLDRSRFVGRRKPAVLPIELDKRALQLASR